MLLEIRCEKFATKVGGKLVPRGPITFHEGLNTILGDKKAQNSIGKSTFLLIVDFCFGGDDYCDPKKCSVVTFVGHHTIQFAFKFGGVIERYSRDTLGNGKVKLCNEKYEETGEEMTIAEFHEHLHQAYNIKVAQSSFRSIVGRFSRIYGRDNYDEHAPLKYSEETVANAIKEMEKLYGVFNQILEYEECFAKGTKKRAVRKAGTELGEIAAVATSVKQVKANEKEIERLSAELEELTANQDRELAIQDTEHLDQAVKLKGQITALKRRRTRLVSQLTAVRANLEGGMVPTSDDIAELQEFFPDVAIEKLETIELFHKKLQDILKEEMTTEIDRLELLIAAATDEMRKLEDEQRGLGVPTHVSKRFLEQVVDLERRIQALKAQNHGYSENKILAAEVKMAKTQLVSARESLLAKVQATINQEMIRLNDFIYDRQRYAPEIKFSDTQSGNPAYTFGCIWNTGTGENYKNLIIFDLSVLSTTELPVLIHDSLIFKNIADLPIDKIMTLYMQSQKQIFIAFDKQEAFDDFVATTVAKTKVIELYDDGGELFGWSWAKKQPVPSEQQKPTEQQDIAEKQSGKDDTESPEQQ